MKRLIFSDLHLHTWAYGATVTEQGFNSRLWSQWQAVQQMIEEVEEHGIEYAYFCGDMFHQHGTVPTQALVLASAMVDQLRKRKVKIRAIPGNHDQYSRDGHIHALSWLEEGELYGHWVDEGLTVTALPYTEDEERIKQFLGHAADAGGVVLLHQGVSGVPLSSGYVLDERLTPEMIPDNVRAFTGHYHFHRAVTPNLTVVGNLTPLNWSDIDQSKGWVIWDDETGEMEQHLQSAAPSFITWNADIAGHSDIENVQNAFVRYTDPVEAGSHREDIRRDLVEAGALSVEFPKVEVSGKADFVRTGDDMTVEHLIEVFENQDMDDRRRQVGVEIRENRYATPTT